MTQSDRFQPISQQQPLARLQTVIAQQSRSLRVGWFGVVCGETPTLTLALSDSGLTCQDWKLGQPLILRIPLGATGSANSEVYFQGCLDEVRDWYGKLLLRARLTKADGAGCHLSGQTINQLCRSGGWPQLFVPRLRLA